MGGNSWRIKQQNRQSGIKLEPAARLAADAAAGRAKRTALFAIRAAARQAGGSQSSRLAIIVGFFAEYTTPLL
jgi:hypothetical protein